MSQILYVIVNGASQLEYDRSKGLPNDQMQALEQMDKKMDAGIPHNGNMIANPDPLQRAQFVATQLVQAVVAGNEAMAAATCTYLAQRVPELQQVVARETEQGLHFDLVFDKPFMNETKIEFMKPN